MFCHNTYNAMTTKVVKTVEPYSKQIDTGDKPLLFLCADENINFKHYVVKYANLHNGSCLKLLTELIGASLAKKWNLNTPDFAIVDVQSKHIKQLPKIAFEKKCFGSEFQNGAFFLDNDIFKKSRQSLINNFNKKELLKIGLFDIWTSNEDRNWNNANLLYSIEQNGTYSFISIDYGACFNSCNYHFELLTDNEVIFEHDLYKKLFVDSRELLSLAADLKAETYNFIKDSQLSWEAILSSIPKDWQDPYFEKIEILERTLFSDTWLKKVFAHFDYVIKHSLRKGH